VTPPPSIFLLWYKSIIYDACLESPLAPLNNPLKNLQICKISNIYCRIKIFSEKGAKTKSVRTMINYTFLKSPWPSKLKYAKIFSRFSKPKCVFKKNLNFLFKASVHKSAQNFFAKIAQSALLCCKLSKEL